eukprot:CAMPEP_0117418988 /NCGR_PEP_ID=MMETSP0758-20121206/658_1 /TAXON_ID=63605 /ORGANISM="Percolomonas cosmopolitus, Strain AE-1 (ATCC 50343)" /LENGTH=803 /DNA_ID=CAMNT_0005199819 /DNA_START=875 /DNA_END=3286 /DNA_ORIENTATION=+
MQTKVAQLPPEDNGLDYVNLLKDRLSIIYQSNICLAQYFCSESRVEMNHEQSINSYLHQSYWVPTLETMIYYPYNMYEFHHHMESYMNKPRDWKTSFFVNPLLVSLYMDNLIRSIYQIEELSLWANTLIQRYASYGLGNFVEHFFEPYIIILFELTKVKPNSSTFEDTNESNSSKYRMMVHLLKVSQKYFDGYQRQLKCGSHFLTLKLLKHWLAFESRLEEFKLVNKIVGSSNTGKITDQVQLPQDTHEELERLEKQIQKLKSLEVTISQQDAKLGNRMTDIENRIHPLQKSISICQKNKSMISKSLTLLSDELNRYLNASRIKLRAVEKTSYKISKEELIELKSYHEPPDGVNLIVHCLCIIFSIDPIITESVESAVAISNSKKSKSHKSSIKSTNKNYKIKKTFDYWNPVKKLMTDVHFIDMIKNIRIRVCKTKQPSTELFLKTVSKVVKVPNGNYKLKLLSLVPIPAAPVYLDQSPSKLIIEQSVPEEAVDSPVTQHMKDFPKIDTSSFNFSQISPPTKKNRSKKVVKKKTKTLKKKKTISTPRTPLKSPKKNTRKKKKSITKATPKSLKKLKSPSSTTTPQSMKKKSDHFSKAKPTIVTLNTMKKIHDVCDQEFDDLFGKNTASKSLFKFIEAVKEYMDIVVKIAPVLKKITTRQHQQLEVIDQNKQFTIMLHELENKLEVLDTQRQEEHQPYDNLPNEIRALSEQLQDSKDLLVLCMASSVTYLDVMGIHNPIVDEESGERQFKSIRHFIALEMKTSLDRIVLQEELPKKKKDKSVTQKQFELYDSVQDVMNTTLQNF